MHEKPVVDVTAVRKFSHISSLVSVGELAEKACTTPCLTDTFKSQKVAKSKRPVRGMGAQVIWKIRISPKRCETHDSAC